MYDVIALGELLIDFTPNGKSGAGNSLFETNPGGAPANVLAALAKLGKKTSFIGKVGQDPLGQFLGKVLEEIGIDTQGLIHAEDVNTTLAFVHLSDDGERSFHFYRNPGADMMLDAKEVDLQLIKNAKVFHFGSISMTHEPAKTATLKAVQTAKENGVLISYDPNLRPALWDTLELAKEHIHEGFQYADIVKISLEELEFISGTDDLERGSRYLFENYSTKLMLITLGDEGCFYRLANETGHVHAFKIDSVDTTGAGDAFLGGLLYQLIGSVGLSLDLNGLTSEEIRRMITFANAMGALATTKKGAIPAMPSLEDIQALLRNDSRYSKMG